MDFPRRTVWLRLTAIAIVIGAPFLAGCSGALFSDNDPAINRKLRYYPDGTPVARNHDDGGGTRFGPGGGASY